MNIGETYRYFGDIQMVRGRVGTVHTLPDDHGDLQMFFPAISAVIQVHMGDLRNV